MHVFGTLLSSLGRHGPLLLVISLFAGIASPSLAWSAYKLLPLSAFLLTFGSFLSVGFAPPGTPIRRSVVFVALAWVGVGLPLAASVLLISLPLDPSLRAGMLLSLLAPPVGSAAAIAAMLGLQVRLALVVSIALTLASPFLMPVLAALLHIDVMFDWRVLTVRLLGIIGAAVVIAFVSVRFRQKLLPILPDQRAAAGIAVIGLIIVGLATSSGIQTQWINDPARFAKMLAAAVAINFGICGLSALVFSRLGAAVAGTIGLVSGNRNVTLAWAAASFGLTPLAEGYVAACVIPVLALPLLVRLGVAFANLGGKSRRRQFGVRFQP